MRQVEPARGGRNLRDMGIGTSLPEFIAHCGAGSRSVCAAQYA